MLSLKFNDTKYNKSKNVAEEKNEMPFDETQLNEIKSFHQEFSQLLTKFLSNKFRERVDIKLVNMESLPFEVFMDSIPNESIIGVFYAPDLKQKIVMELDPNVAIKIIDNEGGKIGLNQSSQKRVITEMDNLLLKRIFSNISSLFHQSWGLIFNEKPMFNKLEHNSSVIETIFPNKQLFATYFNIKIGRTNGIMSIGFPISILETIFPPTENKESVKEVIQNKKELQSTINKVEKTEYPFILELGRTHISVQEFLDLKPDDVVSLDKSVQDPIVARVGKNPKYLGKLGQKDGRIAIQINQVLNNEQF